MASKTGGRKGMERDWIEKSRCLRDARVGPVGVSWR